MNFDLIVADPPWSFDDKLTMSDVKRGSESQYDVLTTADIIKLDVESIASDDAVLVLWVPSSLLQAGMSCMKEWGFDQTQTFIWVKTKKPENVFKTLKKDIKTAIKLAFDDRSYKDNEALREIVAPLNMLDSFNLNECLNFFMGRLFRQTHEIALVGKRGKVYDKLKNKAQRSVLLDINLKHSAKPEGLQDRLEVMFPGANKLELFARRVRPGWECVGLECPASLGEDIRDSIKRLEELEKL
jgi:N6-adenosine-specific RNA methylase IME4